MRADAVGIEAIEHLRDGLQVGKVLLADLPALLDGGDQFAHVGGQLRDALRVKVELQYAFYLGKVGRLAAEASPEFVPAAQVLRPVVGFQPVEDTIDLVHGRGRQKANGEPCRGDAQLVHLIDQRPDGVHSFLCTGDLRGDKHVHRAVRVQRRHRIGRDRVLWHHVHGHFHAILPVFYLTGG